MRFDTLAGWLAWQENLHSKPIDLGLSRVRTVFGRIMPEGRKPFTITVGGTNGKGSCVAMLDAILRAAGYRVGAYTSPHLLRYNERICVQGHPVGDTRIVRAFERIDTVRRDVSLSFFEFGTLAALDIFSQENLDVQILEVGLGGRLDAVNIIDPDIALISSIDIDHQDWLGETRSSIGLEKAGIFRHGGQAVVGDPDIPASVTRYAANIGVHLQGFGREFGCDLAGDGWNWHGETGRYYNLPMPAIPGTHQLMNAAAVLAVLGVAGRLGLPVSEEAVRAGLTRVRLSGRFQYIPGTVPVLIDVAHNPHAVRALCNHIRQYFPDRRIHAVFSVMRDKDIQGIIHDIKDVIDAWYLAPLRLARAARPEELAVHLENAGAGPVFQGFSDVGDACRVAREGLGPNDLMLVFGSFFLVSDYLACAV